MGQQTGHAPVTALSCPFHGVQQKGRRGASAYKEFLERRVKEVVFDNSVVLVYHINNLTANEWSDIRPVKNKQTNRIVRLHAYLHAREDSDGALRPSAPIWERRPSVSSRDKRGPFLQVPPADIAKC